MNIQEQTSGGQKDANISQVPTPLVHSDAYEQEHVEYGGLKEPEPEPELVAVNVVARPSGSRRVMERRCAYTHCENPTRSHHFYSIDHTTRGGGRDWSLFAGRILCSACYNQ